tara:strand:+ start:401 stop:622 length:222 start_codon:yes stop_codon:yes gene_type:complete
MEGALMDWVNDKTTLFVGIEEASSALGISIQTVKKAVKETGELIPGVKAINVGTGSRVFLRFSTLELRKAAGL